MTIKYQFSADAKTVFENLTSADFLKRRCDIQGEIKVDCKVSEKKGVTTLVLDRTIRRDLPSILAKMFNPENRTIMTETWKASGDTYQGEYEIEVKGQPVTLFAKFKLENNVKGSLYTIDHSCKARVPLVGKHVEKFVIGQIAAGFNKEMDILEKEFK
jgi:hypothetical protein